MKNHNLMVLFFFLFLAICFVNYSFVSNDTTHVYDLKYPPDYGPPNIPADNPLTEEGVWLGRLLFYDSILSINNNMSCAGCHKQKLSFTDGLSLSIGVHGDTLKRNSMPLLNLAWHKYFFWDGRTLSLEEVIRQPINNSREMGGLGERELIKKLKDHPYYPTLFSKAFPHDSISIITVSKSISQFLRTIIATLPAVEEKFKKYPVGSPQYSKLITENTRYGTIARAFLMQCSNTCHTSQSFTYGGQHKSVYQDDSEFVAPILINLKNTGPYMHDGRFKTMREVFQFYNDSLEFLLNKNPKIAHRTTGGIKFTQYDLDHADELFEVYDDSTVNVNPNFSNPFEEKGFNWSGIKRSKE